MAVHSKVTGGSAERRAHEAGVSADAARMPTGARFEVRAPLGAGGMGTVHRAFDRLHGREVALKVGKAVGPDRDAARIAEEFALLASLDHPGLVRVLDFGMGAASAWLTSEIVAGPRLDVWAARPTNDEAALEGVARELLETLAWLHARGLVHGDVKPANVLVGAAGPVLIDFGLAGSGETLFGATRAYAAPEILAGAAPSAASDLFALGRTLQRVAASGRTSRALDKVVAALTREEAKRRATVADALATLGATERAAALESAEAPAKWTGAAWSGAVERALRELERAHLDVRAPRAHRAAFLGALAARLMLAGRPAWTLPALPGLAPFARVAAALGVEVSAPAGTHAIDQKEVLDAFADRLVSSLASVPEAARPVLVAGDAGALGAAGRFVLARLVEARALPGFVIAGREDGQALERGVELTFVRVEVLASEAAGRRWDDVWGGLSAWGKALARELVGLGGAARVDELDLGGGDAVIAVRRALNELVAAGLTERANEGRTALQADFTEALEALGGVSGSDASPGPSARLPITLAPPSDAERRRWLEALTKARAPSEAMLAKKGEHAAALGAKAIARAAYRAAAAEAEAAFVWARAAEHHLAAARLGLALGEHEAAFEAARLALHALSATGGGPKVDAALAVARECAGGVADARKAELAAAVGVLEAKVALERGRGAEAAAKASEVLARDGAGAPTLPWKVRFEALLVRGTALSQGDDRAGAERDLAAAAALAEEANDLHALGRTANNLGMLAFHRGDLAAAADAWARAADAKAKTGDRRGERIGRHNRGLALRELGRLGPAQEAADEAAALSEQIGDQVGRATAALAKAQLALDRAEPAAAEAALATFAEVGWKPAMVEADGRLVRVRLALAKGALEAAEAEATAALEAAIAARLEPVAAEAWALSQVITRRPSAAPELVRGPLARAAHEHGGLALLLLCARVYGEAEGGDWGAAREGLAVIAARLTDPKGGLPPAARVGLPLAIEAARLVEPRVAEVIEAAARGEAPSVRAKAAAGAGAGAPKGDPRWDRFAALLAWGEAAGPGDVAAWAERLRTALGAERVELVPLEGEAFVAAREVDDTATARFAELGRRVGKSGERFVGRGADGQVQAVGEALALRGVAVGALVAAFAPGASAAAAGAGASAELGAALGPVVELVALAVAHELERRRRARFEVEAGRLDEALKQHIAQHEAEVTALRDALEQSQSALALRYDYGAIVHRSAAMRRILTTLDKVTDRELPVLVLGESGVGKELLARALHVNGPRKNKRFMAENCGAIPKDLFESQFFGHVKGAFTGALTARQGMFEAAEGGTLFLDEVGELPLEMQVKLLRVLQEKKVRPVGSNREVEVDFRLVCATNRDLQAMVAAGTFREDLYYRIAVVRIEVPPLRQRPEDIVPIAEKLLALHAERLGRSGVRLTPEAADRLAAYPFPGNVRELDNEIMRALALSDGPEIKPRHLSLAIQGKSEPRRRPGAAADGGDGALETLEAAFARVEKELLLRHLRHSKGQKVAAAKSLGLSRPGLDAKLVRHGIDVKELARSLKEPTR